MAAGRSWGEVLRAWLGLLAALGLGIAFAWTAFGPGPRQCSASFSFGWLSHGSGAGDLACRGAFGVATVLALAVVLVSVAAVIRLFAPGRVADYFQNGGMALAILLLAPLLLAAALLASPVWLARWIGRRYSRPGGSGASRS